MKRMQLKRVERVSDTEWTLRIQDRGLYDVHVTRQKTETEIELDAEIQQRSGKSFGREPRAWHVGNFAMMLTERLVSGEEDWNQ